MTEVLQKIRQAFTSLQGIRGLYFFLVLFAILPSLVIVYFNVQFIRQHFDREVQGDAQKLGSVLFDETRGWFSMLRTQLETLSQYPEVQQLDAVGCRKLLETIREKNPVYARAGVANLDGHVVCTNDGLMDENVSEERFFKETRAIKGFALDEIRVRSVGSSPSITFGYPILQNGQLTGVVFTSLDINWFERFFSSVRFVPGTGILLVAANGQVLFRYPLPKEYLTGSKIKPSPAGLSIAQSVGRVFFATGIDGEERAYATTVISGSDEHRVVAAVSVPRYVYTLEEGVVFQENILFFILFALIATYAAIVIGRWLIIRPIEHLERAVRNLSHGELLQEQFPIGEFNSLAKAFDELLTSNEHQRDFLQQNEENYRLLIEFLPQGIFVHRMGKIILVNKQAARFLGVTDAQTLVGCSIFSLVDPAYHGLFKEHTDKTKKGDQNPLSLQRLIRIDGTIFDAEVASAPVRYEGRKATLVVFNDVTKRLMVESGFKEAEERFRVVAESVSDIIYERDIVAGTIKWFGDVDRLLGYGPGEFQPTVGAWESSLHSEDRASVAQGIQDTLRTGKTYTGQYRIRKKDGSFATWLDHGRVLYDDAGKPSRWIGACSDITEQKKTREELSETSQLLLQAQEVAHLGVWLSDLATQKVIMSDETYRILGRSKDQFQNDSASVFSFVHADDRDRVNKLVKEAITSSSSFNMDCRVDLPDGQMRWMQVRAEIKRDKKNKATTLLGVVQDITERKTAEETIKAKERWFSLVFEHTTELVHVLDEKGNFSYVSPAFKTVLGYEPSDLMGQSASVLLHPDEIQNTQKIFLDLTSQPERPSIVTQRIKRKDGTFLTMESVASNLLSVPEIHGLVVISRDISERIKTQEDLQKKTEELERMNRFMVGRELKMKELKQKMKQLSGDTTPEPDASALVGEALKRKKS
jgi:PAS domain S-box-containing protein